METRFELINHGRDKVKSHIIEGQCEDCDQDPAKCLLQGYCQYEKELYEQYEKELDEQ